MIKNAKSLIDKSKNLAEKSNISINEVLQSYMFERIIERLSISKYKNNFILKGGLLLSSLMGINTRTTMDMDTCVKGLDLNEEEMQNILNKILSIDLKDNVIFKIKECELIRDDDEYGGLKYYVVAEFDKIKVNLSIDIATGDVITPREIEYEYKMMFEDKSLKIMTYNIETIIAEKFQTIISRNILNSRMKDYYDLYYLINKKEFLKENLKNAIIRTFKNRNTNLESIEDNIAKIERSSFVSDLWSKYSDKHYYAKDISFNDVMKAIKSIKDYI